MNGQPFYLKPAIAVSGLLSAVTPIRANGSLRAFDMLEKRFAIYNDLRTTVTTLAQHVISGKLTAQIPRNTEPRPLLLRRGS
jgi:hypothetical protein